MSRSSTPSLCCTVALHALSPNRSLDIGGRGNQVDHPETAGLLGRASAENRSYGTRLLEPQQSQHLRRAPVAAGRLRGDRGGGAGGHRRRRPVGVRRWPTRHGDAKIRRCLDGHSGTSPAHDNHVDPGYRCAADHHRPGPDLRHRQLARDPGRSDRHQGERLLPGRTGGWQLGPGARCCATCCRTCWRPSSSSSASPSARSSSPRLR